MDGNKPACKKTPSPSRVEILKLNLSGKVEKVRDRSGHGFEKVGGEASKKASRMQGKFDENKEESAEFSHEVRARVEDLKKLLEEVVTSYVLGRDVPPGERESESGR